MVRVSPAIVSAAAAAAAAYCLIVCNGHAAVPARSPFSASRYPLPLAAGHKN